MTITLNRRPAAVYQTTLQVSRWFSQQRLHRNLHHFFPYQLLVLFDVASGMSYEVDMAGSETEQYIINVQWIGEDVLGVKVMPRIQASWVLWGI